MSAEQQGVARNVAYIDPPTEDYLEDRLFDLGNARLNRDGTLLPFVRARNSLQAAGVPVFTADRLPDRDDGAVSHYWSFGTMRNWGTLAARDDVRLRGFILSEPPLIRPDLYAALPELTRMFEEVYVHNTEGDGYSLARVDQSRLRKFYWPQPYDRIDPRADRAGSRSDRIVAISGNHRPRNRIAEHYSTRILFVAALADMDAVNLYGRGWDRWWGRHSMWLPYWKHFLALQRVYRGGCADKIEVLLQHNFSLCFENMSMDGYITEKIFDCFYAGTIPIYIGPHNAAEYLPRDAYISAQEFATPADVARFCQALTPNERSRMRDAARAFVEGPEFRRYHDSLTTILRV
jgi:hypothetical protein